jgi:hypothetical protein
VALTASGREQVQLPRDRSGHADLASALGLAMFVRRGRDGAWYSWLSALSDPSRGRLPEPGPAGLPTRPTVTTRDGSLELPKRPAIVGVAGPQVTLPGAGPPAYADPEAHRPIAFRRPA